ncbi:transposase [Kosakonia sp. S42]|uniref:transposase n=1 Tax=Kosakonia sp. S42 TaxID=2767458 RepID=UPI001F4899DE|nr:transposase [Kosakonia sp. S42]
MAELSLQPGACVAELAREHGVNDNLVFNCRNPHRQGLLDPASRATLIPVTVEPLSPPRHMEPYHQTSHRSSVAS